MYSVSSFSFILSYFDLYVVSHKVTYQKIINVWTKNISFLTKVTDTHFHPCINTAKTFELNQTLWLTGWHRNDEKIRDEMIRSQSKKKKHSIQLCQDRRVIFLEMLSAVVFRWCDVLSARMKALHVSSNPPILIFTFCICVCVFRDASGERYWDDVSLCHLHLHKAAARGSFGLQRSIPEGTLHLFIVPSSSSSSPHFSLLWLHFPASLSALMCLCECVAFTIYC